MTVAAGEWDDILERASDAERAGRHRIGARLDELPYTNGSEPPTFGLLQRPLVERLGLRELTDISREDPPPLHIGRLDPEGHTILYGTGGIGKGVLASSWIVDLVSAGERVLIVDYEHHPREWARRIIGLGGLDAATGVRYVAPLAAAWDGYRGPLWKQAGELAELVKVTQSTYVVVDSLVPACAGVDPLKPEAAGLYAAGLEQLDVPALSLAHVTKAEDLRYPFGSAFWHHLARTTWSLSEYAPGRVLLEHRKHNNYAPMASTIVSTTWHEGHLGEVSEQGFAGVLLARVLRVLTEPMTIGEILVALADEQVEDGPQLKADSVRHALRRALKGVPPSVTKSGERWSRRSTGHVPSRRPA